MKCTHFFVVYKRTSGAHLKEIMEVSGFHVKHRDQSTSGRISACEQGIETQYRHVVTTRV
jgi:hypothetical protein